MSGTLKTPRDRMPEILRRLKATYPDADIMLRFSSPFELLIATILAAQCTDERVNQVTSNLFRKYRNPQDYLAVPLEELEEDIRSTGFFHNKALSIKKCCQALVDRHGGRVPSVMEHLVELGGVGRKTANVILGNAFGIRGIAVDTHVRRLSGLLGLSAEQDPDRIEADLAAITPREEWTGLGHLFAHHGRAICVARRPRCSECVLRTLCPSAKA
jgi:endonuclease-3